jgi:hypothetical protein
MPRFDGEVFLFGTAISNSPVKLFAPVSAAFRQSRYADVSASQQTEEA